MKEATFGFILEDFLTLERQDDEFESYCKMAEEKSLPKPNRNSQLKPLHEGII